MSKKRLSEIDLTDGMTSYTAHSDELAIATLAELGIEASESDYRMALERIKAIFDAKPGTPEGDELEKLASFVEAYEEEHYPI
ncbi:MAG: hypothetical protein ACTH7F_02985 [Vibrio casei]|uniref:hypothetical protein n=1 Tax=Vibrio casei TaxID=673372 RepID=UPI003F980441